MSYKKVVLVGSMLYMLLFMERDIFYKFRFTYSVFCLYLLLLDCAKLSLCHFEARFYSLRLNLISAIEQLIPDKMLKTVIVAVLLNIQF